MMRRCILELSSGHTRRWIPQMPYFLCSRKGFSVASRKNATSSGSAPPEKPPTSGNPVPKVLLGGALLGGVIVAAYQAGYLRQPYEKDNTVSFESSKLSTGNAKPDHEKKLEEQVVDAKNNEFSGSDTEFISRKDEAQITSPYVEEMQSSRQGEKEVQGEAGNDTAGDEISPKGPGLAEPNSTIEEEDPNKHSGIPEDEGLVIERLGNEVGLPESAEENREISKTTSLSEESGALEGSDSEVTSNTVSMAYDNEDNAIAEVEMPISLSDAYLLQEGNAVAKNLINEGATDARATNSKGKEAPAVASEESKDAHLSNDGKLVLDFIEAIHAAERKQAEQDAKTYAEEKRKMKDKYEKELKDARARELMFAEEAALLDQEVNTEREKAAAAIKSLQEKADEKLKLELEQKEEESEMRLKNAQELAKAETAAAIAKEKAAQIEKMAEANLNINALCMAFFARSEEARQSHTAHRLALGVIALEDALSKGLPIQAEINALYSSLEENGSAGSDSFLNVVFSSLPKDTLERGVDTQLQLNQKFDALKGILRHFSLIPAGSGGMLAHTVAHIASMLKVKEAGHSGDGIESVISRVEDCLAEGKLVEAAELLEGSVRGSQAEEVVVGWVQQARNRAILEQALTLLQSYATSISLSKF